VVARKSDDERKVPLSVRVLPSTKERLQRAADQLGLPLTELLKKWLAQKLAEHELRHSRDDEPARAVPKGGRRP
jgi:hypothetical protein